MKWLEPDERWEMLYGIKSIEDFVSKFVVTPKFHSNVPKDIVTAFETVSYLLAHSYYHWPLQDEALRKALLIIEIAIKQKAKTLNIALETAPNKQGKTFSKKLVDLIDEVCKAAHLDFLKPDFDRARNLRNSFVHPDTDAYMGALTQAKSNFMLFNNVINQLFLQPDEIKSLLEKRKQITAALEPFKNGNFVLEYNNTKILMDIVHYHKYIQHQDKELLLLLVNPVLNNPVQYLNDQKFEEPLVIALKEFKINKKTVEGRDLNDGEVKIEPTNKEENIIKFLMYNKELQKVSDDHIHTYNAFRSGKALWEMEKIMYTNLWE